MICFGILCLALAAPSGRRQGVLPSSFAGWTASALRPRFRPPTGLDPLLGPDAPAFREYIVKSVEQRSYAQGTQTASITLYRLRDPSSATAPIRFCATIRSLPSIWARTPALPMTARSSWWEKCCSMSPAAPKQARPSDADLKQLADSLDKIADHTPYPFIGEHLPEKGRVKIPSATSSGR